MSASDGAIRQCIHWARKSESQYEQATAETAAAQLSDLLVENDSVDHLRARVAALEAALDMCARLSDCIDGATATERQDAAEIKRTARAALSAQDHPADAGRG